MKIKSVKWDLILREMFPGHLILLHGDIGWPARSPDLNPYYFFFSGDTSSQRYTVITLNLQNNLKMQFVKKLLPFHMKWPAEL